MTIYEVLHGKPCRSLRLKKNGEKKTIDQDLVKKRLPQKSVIRRNL